MLNDVNSRRSDPDDVQSELSTAVHRLSDETLFQTKHFPHFGQIFLDLFLLFYLDSIMLFSNCCNIVSKQRVKHTHNILLCPLGAVFQVFSLYHVKVNILDVFSVLVKQNKISEYVKLWLHEIIFLQFSLPKWAT